MINLTVQQRYQYLRKNSKTCKECSCTKSLLSFFNQEDNTINELCRKCYKKHYKEHIRNIVLKVLTETEGPKC